MQNSIESKSWGTFEGEEVRLWRLVNANGMELHFTNYGGRLIKAIVPDRNGNLENVTGGYDTLDEYLSRGTSFYYGALVGRYGNRIGHGKFTLEGKEYQLELNNDPGGIPCGLHGGLRGFSLRNWKVVEEIHTEDKVGLVMEITSPDGEGGFPGNVTARVLLTLDNKNVWHIGYKATTDKATPIAMTEHAYWNLNGTNSGTTILGHKMYINADHITAYNEGMIPTGELRDVTGTPFDFRTMHAIGDNHDEDYDQLKYGAGYDMNWVLRKTPGDELTLACILTSEESGRQLEVWTTEPGIQVYDGYYLEERNSSVALETQHYPDSPNKPEFPSTIVRPGEVYYSTTEYRFKTI